MNVKVYLKLHQHHLKTLKKTLLVKSSWVMLEEDNITTICAVKKRISPLYATCVDTT